MTLILYFKIPVFKLLQLEKALQPFKNEQSELFSDLEKTNFLIRLLCYYGWINCSYVSRLECLNWWGIKSRKVSCNVYRVSKTPILAQSEGPWLPTLRGLGAPHKTKCFKTQSRCTTLPHGELPCQISNLKA